MYLVTDIGPFDRPEFWEALDRNISEINAARRKRTKVGLVVLDSLYNYHPADVEVSNLYERGRLLAGLSAPLVERGIALWVVDHFNKSGSGIDLDRLAQSGMSAWADSWMLFEHADGSPDVPNGVFSISTGIGSRQWGGEDWTLHLDIGPFDKESSGYLTAMKVEAHAGITKRANGGSRGSGASSEEAREVLLEVLDAFPDQQQKSEIRAHVVEHTHIGTGKFNALWADLESQRLIRSVTVDGGADALGRRRTLVVWARATPDEAKVRRPAPRAKGEQRARRRTTTPRRRAR